jgi:RNA polymerase sigma-70 factor, ECF subfamily
LKATSVDSATTGAVSDSDLARRVSAGDHIAFEALMRQFNRPLFRVARSILEDDTEAEDALQEAYVTAYGAMNSFRGESKLSTWLTRIVINEALGRLRKQKRDRVVIPFSSEGQQDETAKEAAAVDESKASPEAATLRAEIRRLLERKIDELPMAFRTVFMMRELEEMTVEETARCLDIPEATVRSRHFRAKGLLRESLARDIDVGTADAFAFLGERCDRIVAKVLNRINATTNP